MNATQASNNLPICFYAEQRATLDDQVRFFDGENSFWIPARAIKSNRPLKGRDREVVVERWAAVAAGTSS